MGNIHRHEGLANKNFVKPDGLTTITYCSATGLSPTDLCSQDYYGKTTHSDLATTDFGGPGGTCDLHKTYDICKESGKIAAPTCPPDCHMEVVLAVNGDKIVSKPSTIPEGKMDINISEACDMQHGQVPVTDHNMPVDPGADDMIPSDENWNEEDFGIQ